MNYTDRSSRVLHRFIIIAAMALVAACNTTPAVRSSGAPGSPGSPGSTGASVKVDAPGMPDAPGAGLPDTPVPGSVSIPSPQPGLPSGKPDGIPSTAQSGKTQSPAAPRSTTGTGQNKTDDEILAEALEELNKRSSTAQQAAEAEGARGQLPQASAGGPSTTDVERKQVLGKRLEEGFAEFDQIMLSEQEAISKEANEEGYGDFSDGDVSGEAESAEEPLQTAMVDSDPVSVKGEGNTATRDHSRVPPDLVSAEGDDIIARQLREAAMKEQDPELREKLWDEYRKYKRDLR